MEIYDSAITDITVKRDNRSTTISKKLDGVSFKSDSDGVVIFRGMDWSYYPWHAVICVTGANNKQEDSQCEK